MDVNAEHDMSYVALSPDQKTVTVWFERQTNFFDGITFSLSGHEPPVSLGRHPSGLRSLGGLTFQNDLRRAMVIKDGLIHRWSVENPGGLGPGIPSPFAGMRNDTSPDGRFVNSIEEDRIFDAGAWPARPSGGTIRPARTNW